jgi:hypothetical protein
MVVSLCSNCSILVAIATSVIGGGVIKGGALTLVYLYHPHHLYHLYHHDLFELLHYDLHHDLISILGKGQNNAHEGG